MRPVPQIPTRVCEIGHSARHSHHSRLFVRIAQHVRLLAAEEQVGSEDGSPGGVHALDILRHVEPSVLSRQGPFCQRSSCVAV